MTSTKNTTDFRQSKSLIFVSWLSLTFYVLFKLSTSYIPGLHIEAIFMLIFLGGIFFRPWQLKSDIAVRLIGLSLFLPVLFFIINYFFDSELAFQYFSPEKLFKLMAFATLGFWLGGKLKNIYIFLSLVFLGLIIALFNVDIFLSFKEIFSGKRVDFDIKNAQYTAMFFGLAIIGFICFYKEFIFSSKPGSLKIILIVIFFLSLTLSLIVFIGSQTRTSLFALNILFIISIIHFFILKTKKRTTKNTSYIFYIYMIFSIFLLSTSTVNTMKKRGYEQGVTSQLSNGNLNNIPMSSLGIRINTWIEAGKWIKQKPLQGWGGNVRTHVIQQSNFSDHIKKNVGHFHNSYIEFTLAYGLIGLAFILYIFIWINREIYLLHNKNKKFQGVWLFTLYGSLYLMVINLFESYIFFGKGVYAMAFLLAPAYSLYLSKVYYKNT